MRPEPLAGSLGRGSGGRGEHTVGKSGLTFGFPNPDPRSRCSFKGSQSGEAVGPAALQSRPGPSPPCCTRGGGGGLALCLGRLHKPSQCPAAPSATRRHRPPQGPSLTSLQAAGKAGKQDRTPPAGAPGCRQVGARGAVHQARAPCPGPPQQGWCPAGWPRPSPRPRRARPPSRAQVFCPQGFRRPWAFLRLRPQSPPVPVGSGRSRFPEGSCAGTQPQRGLGGARRATGTAGSEQGPPLPQPAQQWGGSAPAPRPDLEGGHPFTGERCPRS